MNTNLIQSQIEIEKKFYRLHIEESLKNTWNELLVKLREDAESEPELNNYIPTIIRTLFILNDYPKGIMFHNIVEIIMDKTDLENSLEFVIKCLDLMNEYQLITYDQLPKYKCPYALKVRPRYLVDEDEQIRLDNSMNLFPLITKPKKVKYHRNNRGSGYLTISNDSLLLGLNYHQDDICRELLDKQNSIQFDIDKLTLNDVQRDIQTSKIIEQVELNNLLDGKSNDPEKIVQQAEENLEKMKLETLIAYEHIKDYPIYLTHKYDYRGRMYCNTYHFNYQGDSYLKAILELHNKELISEEINFNL